MVYFKEELPLVADYELLLGVDVLLSDWMFEFLHFCSTHLNGCGMLCPTVQIFRPQHLVVVPCWDYHVLLISLR